MVRSTCFLLLCTIILADKSTLAQGQQQESDLYKLLIRKEIHLQIDCDQAELKELKARCSKIFKNAESERKSLLSREVVEDMQSDSKFAQIIQDELTDIECARVEGTNQCVEEILGKNRASRIQEIVFWYEFNKGLHKFFSQNRFYIPGGITSVDRKEIISEADKLNEEFNEELNQLRELYRKKLLDGLNPDLRAQVKKLLGKDPGADLYQRKLKIEL